MTHGHFKLCLLDLDNTLYDYDRCESISRKELFKEIKRVLHTCYDRDISINEIEKIYLDARLSVHNRIEKSTSKHSRYLYIKTVVDRLEIKFSYIPLLYDIYNKKFMESMRPYKGVKSMLRYLKKTNCIVCLLTDFALREQLDKISRLNLNFYIDHIISSEEMGVEKPNPSIYEHILSKFSVAKKNTFIIGDNIQKDIMGGINNKMFSILFSKTPTSPDELMIKKNKNVRVFSTHDDIKLFLKKINQSVGELANVAKFIGTNDSFTQLGGGNISVKSKKNEMIFIKASGREIKSIVAGYGYTVDHYKKYKINGKYLTEPLFLSSDKDKHSIETPFHTGFSHKYVVHLHMDNVNIVSIRTNAKKILLKLFPDSLIIPYRKPGSELFDLIKSYSIKRWGTEWNSSKQDRIIFLLNHGIIFLSNSLSNMYTLIDVIDKILKDYIKQSKQFSLKPLELTLVSSNDHSVEHNSILNILRKIFCKKSNTSCAIGVNQKIASFVLDDSANKMARLINEKKRSCFEQSYFPDKIVYCGARVIAIEFDENKSQDFERKMMDFKDEFILKKRHLQFFFVSNQLFAVADSQLVIRNGIEILKTHFKYALVNNLKSISCLDEKEIREIENWEDEKYRLNLNKC